MNNIGPTIPQNQAANQKTELGNGASTIATLGTAKQKVDTNAATANFDKVNLSSQAIDMNALEQAVKQSPDLDASKVVKIHAQVSSGTYQINSADLADKILAFDSRLDR